MKRSTTTSTKQRCLIFQTLRSFVESGRFADTNLSRRGPLWPVTVPVCIIFGVFRPRPFRKCISRIALRAGKIRSVCEYIRLLFTAPMLVNSSCFQLTMWGLPIFLLVAILCEYSPFLPFLLSFPLFPCFSFRAIVPA